ncbi:MAG: hypothetical protein AABY04_02295 [Candidatus Micrarchaeota archaeon]
MGFFKSIGNILSAVGVVFGISDYNNHEGIFKNRPGSPEYRNEQKYDQGSYQGSYKEQRFRQKKGAEPKKNEKPQGNYGNQKKQENYGNQKGQESYEEYMKRNEKRFEKMEHGP